MEHFKVVKDTVSGKYIVVRAKDGTQFTDNTFDTELDGHKFIEKIIKHAREFMAQIEKFGAN